MTTAAYRAMALWTAMVAHLNARPSGRSAMLSGAVLLMTVGALVIRLLALGAHPGGLFPDEAAEGNSAVQIMDVPGFHPVFLADNGGREALYAYLVAAVFRIAGVSVSSLRATSAILGAAAVPVVFLALRRVGGGAALAGAAWTGGALWLVAISRDGMRNALVPVTAALAVWLLLRWAAVPTRGSSAAAGAAAGLGVWTYQPMQLLPLLVVAWLWWLRRSRYPKFPAMVTHRRWLAGGYALLAAPMAVVAVSAPAAYFGRSIQTSPLNPDNSARDMVTHVVRVVGMFTMSGDPNPRHNASGLAMLGWPLGLIAMAGAARAWRLRFELPAASMMLIGVPVFLIPPILAIEGGSPHFLRSLGLAPFVAGLVGMGCAEVADAAARRPARAVGRALAAGVATLTLLGTLGLGARAYVDRPAAEWWYGYSADIVQMAVAARASDTVIITGYNENTLRFIDRGRMPHVVHPPARAHPLPGTRVYANHRADLDEALGAGSAATARVAGRDPAGTADLFVAAG